MAKIPKTISDLKGKINQSFEVNDYVIKVKNINAEAFKRLRQGISLKQATNEIAELNNGELLIGDLDCVVEQVYILHKDLFNLDNLPKLEKVERFLSARYDLRYNIVANRVEYRMKNECKFQQCNENTLHRDLTKNFIEYSLNGLISLLKSDFVPKYDPLSDYFTGLPKWDGTEHIDKLASYIHVKLTDKERFKKNFKKMFIRMVACAMDEMVFNKQCFVLVHEKQNSGKTSFCNWLCPPGLEGYSKDNFSVDKDGKISLCENFIINLDELASLSKADINQLKSIFTLAHVKERLPYDRTPSTMARRASFVGSTNNREFLSDETGSVRWLCFEIEDINFSYRQDCDIDLIYSQAYGLWKSGAEFNLSPDDITLNEAANEEFHILTSERELIEKFFEKDGSNDDKEYLTNVEILEYLIEKTANRIRLNSTSIGKSLKQLGYLRVNFGPKGKQRKGYFLSKKQIDVNDNKYKDYSESNRAYQEDILPF